MSSINSELLKEEIIATITKETRLSSVQVKNIYNAVNSFDETIKVIQHHADSGGSILKSIEEIRGY